MEVRYIPYLPVLLCTGLLLCRTSRVAAQSSGEPAADQVRAAPQDTVRQPVPDIEILPVILPWLNTHNPAGLAMTPLPDVGRTAVTGASTDGKFYRPQEAESSRRFRFVSEHYQRLNAASLYGQFSYTQISERNVQMNDLLDAYRGTPYILADSIGGDWKKQLYQLSVKAASGKLWRDRLHAGAAIDYRLSTGARQNDPRPLNNRNELALIPGIVWDGPKGSRIGLNGWWSFSKEQVDLSIKNTSMAQRIYKLTGLGQYDIPTTTTTGAGRLYDGKKYGGDLQYSVNIRNWHWLTEASFRFSREKVIEGSSTIPRVMAEMAEKQYGFSSQLQRQAGRWAQNLTLEWQHSEGTGTEHTWTSSQGVWKETLVGDFYQSVSDKARLGYQLFRQQGPQNYVWLLDASLTYSSLENKYLYPYSIQQLKRLEPALRGSRVWRAGANEWTASARFAYSAGLSRLLDWQPMTTTSNLVAGKVLYPDHDYLTANRWLAGCSLQFSRPVTERDRTRWFLRTAAELLNRADRSTIVNGPEGQRWNLSVTIGFLY